MYNMVELSLSLLAVGVCFLVNAEGFESSRVVGLFPILGFGFSRAFHSFLWAVGFENSMICLQWGSSYFFIDSMQ